ncbi:MAG: PH domain-containing protein [Xanthomarina sp.]
MKIYTSKCSFTVKLITIGIIVSMGMLIFSISALNDNYGTLSAIILSVIILVALIYFYANSLNKIIVSEKHLTLKKPFSKIEIPLSDLIRIERLEFSNLSMTSGSQGIFGYIGNTMDGSICMVKDRKKMIRIITKEKNYTISSEKPADLINYLKNVS